MTLPLDERRPDPRSLPLFASRARRADAGEEHVGRPARPRSASGLHAVPAGEPSGTPTPRRATGSEVDWELVAAFRSQASELLTKQLGGDRLHLDKAAQEALGRSIIVELLEAAAADAVTAGRPSWTPVQQDELAQAIFNALFRMGRLQPLIEDDRIENISIVGFDGVWLDLADGSRVPGPPVADSDQELTDFLTFLASRSEMSARPFSEAQPKLHLQLDDGSRLAATAWVSPRPLVLIRRHRLTEVSLQDLVDRQALSPLAASFLTAAVRARLSVVVAGAQGFGKTTMARALCGAFDPKESIATLESEFELGLHEMPERHKIVYAW